jgi:catechol 2,3-dioxygenase-like lactoylglutathione lyase family enzyme
MARISHLAMNVDDIDKASDFFNKVFGFTQITVPGVRSTVRYLTDGNVHIAINQSRRANPSDGKLADKPRIDHFGIEVDSIDQATADAGKFGCNVISEPGKALKVRDPAGIPLEIIPKGAKPQ